LDFGSSWLATRLTNAFNNCRTLLAGKHGLESAKNMLIAYKQGQINGMTPELWKAKKIVDSTLHPGMD
jgi:hypothetical protein